MTEFIYIETFARDDGERKINVILQVLLKNNGNSRAIDRIINEKL
jgi:hypothetical protein